MAHDIGEWLEALGLRRYEKTFTENEIDLDALHHLTEDDLREIGVALGARRKLQAAIAELNNKVELDETAKATPQTAAREEAERRQLTVMFCDLVGSTQLSQEVDPEDLRHIMDDYRNAVASAVRVHDGHIAKFLGDGVLAYFGWPVAHEDDAQRAVLAALAAMQEVEDLQTGDRRLVARAGIATGPVVVGDLVGQTTEERGAVTGVTPNLAARLQDYAGPGQVIVHKSTKRLIGSTFELSDKIVCALKGFSEQVEAWLVKGAAQSQSRFEAMRGAGLTEFVGRDYEIGLLVDRWHKARDGEGQIALLSGEAGIGKSRVLREFESRLASDNVTILHYQCSPHEINAAFHPIVAEIEAAAGFRPDDTPERKLEKLETRIGSIMSGIDDAVQTVATMLSVPTPTHVARELSPQRQKQRTIEIVVERISRIAGTQPLVLLVEDVHWIDPSSLEAFDAIIAGVREFPVLVLLTFRPEFEPKWTGYDNATLLSLTRLSRKEGRVIAERIAGGKALPNEVLDRILEHTDGVPLFVEELTKAILEAGILSESEDRFVLKGALPALAIPTTLQDSLMARLDRLAPVKRVVQAAACIGREFDADLLSSALAMPREELDEAIEVLLNAQLIFRRRSVRQGSYIFKHALVQDAAYASLLVSARQSLHEKLALALEANDDADALELARHFSGAGLRERASGLFLEAGRKSLAASALPEAIGTLEQGLGDVKEITEEATREHLELGLRVALGTARMANFGWAHPSVSDALEPAFPLAIALSDNEALGSILWGLWVHYQTRTNFPRAHHWLAELHDVAKANSTSNLPVIFDMSAGCQYFWEADYVRAVGHTDHLKRIYNREKHAAITAMTNHDPMVFSQHWAGSLADWISGRPDRSLERLEEAVEGARKIGHPFNHAFALTAGVTALFYCGNAEAVLDYVDEVEQVVEREALGDFAQNVLVNQWRGAGFVFAGRHNEGYELAKKGNDFWNAAGGRVCNAMFRSWIALGLMGLGKTKQAQDVVEFTIQHCRESGDCYMEPECIRLNGDLALQINKSDTERAEACYLEATNLATDQGALSWQLRSATSLAQLYQSDGRPADARACLEPVHEKFSEGHASQDLRKARMLLSQVS